MSLKSGTRLGVYEVVGPLGAGGMGEVYRARDSKLDRHVAIKILPEGLTSDRQRLARFKNEAKTLASLNHPNIAAIYGLEELEGVPFFVLELVDGESLSSRLSRGRIELRESLPFFAQIASAVEAAHDRGIIHRDLKPANIMITPGGTIKVLDFGLAKSGVLFGGRSDSGKQLDTMTAAPTKAGVILGTIAYMSPEQARGQTVDSRSDIWSFGCVLFESLSGAKPFHGETDSDLIAKILEREPDWGMLPDNTPSKVRELLKRCLRRDVSARPRDIRDVRIELTELTTTRDTADSSFANSVAVLPFENLSGPDDEYFADGVTDELLNALGQVEGLRVAARSSCFAFKGKREDLRVVGEKLDVSNVIEGSVRRAGSKLRITVQLVKAVDGYQLWSERYDREMVDVFEVQEEIAKGIATRLRGTLSAEADNKRARRGTQNLEAYEVFLKGRALQNKRGRFLHEAIACFERAISLDPGYAEPMAWLSDSYRLLGTFGVAPPAEVMLRAKEMAEKALRIDPMLSEAWQTLAIVEEQFMWNYQRGTELWDKTFELDPKHSRGRSQRALWGYVRGEWSDEKALAEGRRALADDPLSSWVAALYSQILGFSEHHEESLVEAKRALALDPDSFLAQWGVMRANAWLGNYEEAIALSQPILRDSGRNQWAIGALAWTYGKAGYAEKARAVYDEMEGRSRHEYMAPFWLAVAASAAGLKDRAMEHVQDGIANHDPLVIWGRVIKFWDIIRTYPEIKDATRGIW